jgi:hypothetical protein
VGKMEKGEKGKKRLFDRIEQDLQEKRREKLTQMNTD